MPLTSVEFAPSDDASKSQQGLFDVKADQRSENTTAGNRHVLNRCCSGVAHQHQSRHNAQEKASIILGAEISPDQLNGDQTKVRFGFDSFVPVGCCLGLGLALSLPCMMRVSPCIDQQQAAAVTHI